MTLVVIPTARLDLTLEPTEAVLARIDAMSPEDRAQVSDAWLARLRAATPTPWTHGLSMIERETGAAVGSCGFKGVPDADGIVEIAYGVNAEHRGRGFAKEAASALVDYALANGARLVCALTLPQRGPSTSVLTAIGFEHVADLVDPDDGPVWRWEYTAGGRP